MPSSASLTRLPNLCRRANGAVGTSRLFVLMPDHKGTLLDMLGSVQLNLMGYEVR